MIGSFLPRAKLLDSFLRSSQEEGGGKLRMGIRGRSTGPGRVPGAADESFYGGPVSPTRGLSPITHISETLPLSEIVWIRL